VNDVNYAEFMLRDTNLDLSNQSLHSSRRMTHMRFLDRVKVEGNKRDMPYQSLIKAWLSEDVEDSPKS